MKHAPAHPPGSTRARHAWLCAALASTALLTSIQAPAQTVYRIVGADGRVTFSDKPPATTDKATATAAGARATGGGGAALPFELRQVASRYPVTLYSSSTCDPCGAGRALLTSRGIPFSEKTVTTAEDAEALQRISGSNSLPFLTIGGQQIKGFSPTEWDQFLGAAGYPPSSLLPANYRNPAATPLVVVQKPSTAKPEDNAAPVVEPTRPPVDTGSNPAGIKF